VRQAIAAHALLPSARSTASAPLYVTFRGSITRPTHPLSTPRRVGYPPPRKTRFQLVANLRWAGLAPAGSTSEGFAMLQSYVIVPPSPGFAWRNNRRDFGLPSELGRSRGRDGEAGDFSPHSS
jgi:hypothetical protein